MPATACQAFLKRNRFGVLALAEGGQAYAIPMFYGYDGKRLYFQSHPGMKDEYLNATESACFLVTEVHGPDDWSSVQVHGHVERATLTDDAFAAMEALMKNPLPPEFQENDRGKPLRSAERMFLGILTPSRIAGRKSRNEQPQRAT